MIRRVSFTGTSIGMTGLQKAEVRKWLIDNEPAVLSHGGCIGADDEVDSICDELGIIRVIRPGPEGPKSLSKEHFEKRTLGPTLVIHPRSQSYLDRNKLIVRDGEILLATPKEEQEVLRSGTWATIRYAKKLKRTIKYFWPKG